MKTALLYLFARVRRAFNKPHISITQWTFTPSSAIAVSSGSQYNLFSDAQFAEGSAQVVKTVSGDAELLIAVNEGAKV